MQYNKRVQDLVENPVNVGTMPEDDPSVGTGTVGSPACGDVMKMQIRVDDGGRIVDVKFKTFGCGSAIASASLATEWIKGKTLTEAMEVKNKDIAKELELPPIKVHCSVLAEQAISQAIEDWRKKHPDRQ